MDAACFAEPAPPLFGARDVVAASADGETEVDWARLDWEVDDVMREECMHAPAHVDALIAESDDDRFDEYGAAWINSARASPFLLPSFTPLPYIAILRHVCVTAVKQSPTSRLRYSSRTSRAVGSSWRRTRWR